MPLESAPHLADLNPANPPATDPTAQGDDHLRLIKAAVKATFPNFTSDPLDSTQAQLDGAVASVTGEAPTVLIQGSAATPGASFAGDSDTGLYQPAANEAAVAVGGVKALHIHSDKSVESTGGFKASGGVITGPGITPIGGTIVWWDDTLPASTLYGTWSWCNGGTYLRSNAELFARLGTKFGNGDGTTTANLPDLREAAPIGKSTMGATAARGVIANFSATVLNAIGSLFGESQHTLSTTEMPAHNHGITEPNSGQGHKHGLSTEFRDDGTINTAGNVNGIDNSNVGSAHHTDFAVTGITINDTGGGGAHNNVQPSVPCNWIIRIA